ncbi:ABC transporter permease [Tellurirhabdus rosea]|uniref:ABC transporter permease n=1 Tax=Tellurirhabdus rosea TaxID=2674997 RepID=UPI002257AF7C|nr:ABC transporter permease [Tellurirhabdus rosea]
MLTNYLKIAFRNLWKAPATTAIHLLGLTVGLTTCLLILMVVRYEWGFDRFHAQGERIYRVNLIQTTGSEVEKSAVTPYPLGAALRNDFPEWPTVASIHAEENSSVVVSPEKIFPEKRVLFAEPQLFDLFSFGMKEGDARAILSRPNQAILSESAARKYFGSQSPLGKTLRIGSETVVQVGGIMPDMPAQSHLSAPVIVSYKTLKKYFGFPLDQWGMRSAGSVYVLLPKGASPEAYTARLGRIDDKYYDNRDRSATREFLLQPLNDIHFNPTFNGGGFVPSLAPTYLWVFLAVGGFVLLIACVNFVNLSTARATTRAREVGVRKCIGATGSQLVAQFLSEALWLTAFSSVLALALTYSLLPAVNSFLQKEIPFRWDEALAFLTLLSVLTTLAAGLYPALFMARLRPIMALKAARGPQGQGMLRQSLVVFQFGVSLVLAVGVMVIYQQMKLFREKDLGFRRDAILTINTPSAGQKADVLRQALGRIAGVEDVSFALGAPTAANNFTTGMIADPANRDRRVTVNVKLADAHYLSTYGLKLVAGRFFTDADTLAISGRLPREQRRYVYVVSEKTTRALGCTRPEQALGRTIEIGLNDIRAEIVGVVRDFHTSSLHEELMPMVMMNYSGLYQSVGLKLRTGNYPATLAAIEEVWKRHNPNTLYEAEFLDKALQKLYDEEIRQFTLLRVFAGLALVICCLGLWGLATFTIEQRTKEIGVRKVLGASVASIVALLCKDFLKLVLVALVLASPLAYYLMDRWLAEFAYKIDVPWWAFGLAGALAVTVAFLTVSFQSVKAALMNPVKSLRTE